MAPSDLSSVQGSGEKTGFPIQIRMDAGGTNLTVHLCKAYGKFVGFIVSRTEGHLPTDAGE